MKHFIRLLLEQYHTNQISKNVAHQLLSALKEESALRSGNIGQETDHDPISATTEIAVIGMACRFPGAPNITVFWDNLSKGKGSIAEYPQERWPGVDFFCPDPARPGKSYSKWGGFISDIDQFATSYFKIPVAEARLIDPQQRLFLELAYEIFADSGYAPEMLSGSNTAVFVGARGGLYRVSDDGGGQTVRASLTGAITNFIAARVSDFYNLQGPSLTIDTACSSSLVAVHFACESLTRNECELALVGGVDLKVHPGPYITLSNARVLSRNGKSYVFDRRADGFVPGEGVGGLLLKPYSRAIRDGDRIYAVIKGSAINNDGNTMGITTPGFDGQKTVLRRAYHNAGINPATVSLIEAHGTGTAVGDPIELKALTEVFREFTDKCGFCALGSVKTNIGHLDTAAGIAGLIKIILALYHQKIPPTLHCEIPNPRLNLVESPFFPNVVLRPWEPLDGVRRAGISSFGFGGTNCHVVVESAPARPVIVRESLRPWQLFTLSAQSPSGLEDLINQYIRVLREKPDISLPDLCHTLSCGRDHFTYRLAVVTTDISDLLEKLSRIRIDADLQTDVNATVFCSIPVPLAPSVVFLFPGQDVIPDGHFLRMLYQTEPVFQEAFDQCNTLLEQYHSQSIIGLLNAGQIAATASEQPTLSVPESFAVSYALTRIWLSWGVRPAFLWGDGPGEYVAACISGMLTLPEALWLVVRQSELKSRFSEIGETASLAKDFAAALGQVRFQPVQIPVVCSVFGKILRKGTIQTEYWVENLTRSIRWNECFHVLHPTGPCLFLEMGSGKFAQTVKSYSPERSNTMVLSSLNPDRPDGTNLLSALGLLYIHGVKIDFTGFASHEAYQKVGLLVPSLMRERCWVDQFHSPTDSLVGHPFSYDAKKDLVIHEHVVLGNPILPGVCYWDMALDGVAAIPGSEVYALREITHQAPLTVSPHPRVEMRLAQNGYSFQIVSKVLDHAKSESVTVHASGRVEKVRVPPDPPIPIAVIQARLGPDIRHSETIYRQFQARGVEYGPIFQSIKTLWGSETEALARLELSPEAQTVSGQFLLNPALMDGALQTIIGIHHSGRDQYPATYVPFFVEEIIIWDRLPGLCYSWLRLSMPAGSREILRAEITMSNQDGKVLVKIRGLAFKRMVLNESQALGGFPSGNDFTGYFYQPDWEKEPRSERTVANGYRLVFQDEKNTIHQRITASLERRGQKLVSVFHGPQKEKLADDCYRIHPGQEADYPWLWSELEKAGIVPVGIIHLWTLTSELSPLFQPEVLEEALDRGVYSLFHLIRTFGKTRGQQRLDWQMVSSYSQKVCAGDRLISPEKGMLSGVSRVMALEYPNFSFALIDLGLIENEMDEEIHLLTEELLTQPRNQLVAIRSRQRFGQRIIPYADRGGANGTDFRESGVYVITGGLSGIGLEVATFLAREKRARLVLVSRTGLPPAAEWPDYLEKHMQTESTNDPTIRGIKAVQMMQAWGARVLVCQADVMERTELSAVKANIEANHWEVNGIIHAAGIIDDALLQNKTMAAFRRVLGPKVHGTLALYEIFQDHPLDFFVLFSGMAAILGNIGQGDYAAANSFLDAFAQWAGLQGRFPVISINWTLWSETGMGQRMGLTKQAMAFGLKPLRNHEGLDALVRIIRSCPSQILVMNNDLHHLPRKEASIRAEKMMGKPELMSEDMEPMVERFLLEKVAQLLDISEENIQTEVNFLELGLDSIKLIGITEWLSERLQANLYPTLLFEYATIKDLAGYLTEKCAVGLEGFLRETIPHPQEETRFFSPVETNSPPYGESPAHTRGERWSHPPLRAEKTVVVPEANPVSVAAEPASSEGQNKDIAVIGFSGKFPKAATVDEFWENCQKGVSAISKVPENRFVARNYLTYDVTKYWGGFLEEIREFDPLFFHISPKEAIYMDPQQRLFLEVVWETLEMAGYPREKLRNFKTGVFVGASQAEYKTLWGDSGELNPYMGLGNSLCVIANRVSYLFNLQGPSLSIDTACSSSLVALHMACQSIHTGDADLAIAGGVQLYMSPASFIIFDLAGMLAKDGHCKTFDHEADGYVRGEGVGAVLLKPVSRAIADGDTIYAVIKGSAVNHDGNNKVGISAPNPKAQKEVIYEALRRAQVHPETIGYIEAHGTGTSLGDPVEISGLTQSYREFTDKRSFCAIGSLKTTIGHLEAAAGIAGLIKVILALKNRKIPPTIHFQQPNPHIPFLDSPFYVNDQLQNWEPIHGVRRAAISAFGFGGTNCHVILEEWAPSKGTAPARTRESCILTLSAQNENSLQEILNRMIQYLDDHPDIAIDEVCSSAALNREHFQHRICLVADSPGQLRDRLEILRLKGIKAATSPYGIFYGQMENSWVPRALFVLGGSGSINGEFFAAWKRYRHDEWDEYKQYALQVKTATDYDLELLTAADFSTSPSVRRELFAFGVMVLLTRSWIAFGICPEIFAAYGLGCLAARVITGEITFEEAFAMMVNSSGDLDKLGNSSGSIIIVMDTVDHEKLEKLKHLSGKKNCGAVIEVTSHDWQLNQLKTIMGQELPYLTTLRPGGVPERSLWHSILVGVGQLYVRGARMNWGAYYEPGRYRQRALPPYPLQKQPFWIHDQSVPPQETFDRDPGCSKSPALFKKNPLTLSARHQPSVKPSHSIVPHSATGAVHCFRWQWQKTSIPKVAKLPASGTWVIFYDNLGLWQILTTMLSTNGQKVVGVEAEKSYRRVDSCHYFIRPDQETDYHSIFESIDTDHLEISGILFLKAFTATDDCCRDDEALGTGIRETIHPFFLLEKALSGRTKPLSLFLVTNFGQKVNDQTGFLACEKAPLIAMSKVLAQESKNVHVRWIDFDSQETTTVSQMLMAEFSVQGETEVAYQCGERWEKHLVIHDPVGGKTRSLFQGGKVYVLSGGLTGIGYHIAKFLTQHTDSRLVIIGRTNLPPMIEWGNLEAERESPDPVSLRVRNLANLTARNDKVHYFQADVSDYHQMKQLFNQIRQAYGPVHGIIHCAGINEDASISHKSWESFQKVLAPKVMGTWNLDTLTRDCPLDFFILFSSIAATFGNPGQVDYAAANSFMDSYAQKRHYHDQQPFMAINWPFWLEGGMEMTPAVNRQMSAAGLLPLGTEEALRVFGEISSYQGIANMVVLKTNTPAQKGLDRMVLQDFLVNLMARLLMVKPAELDPKMNFSQLGLDSLVIQDAVRALEDYLGESVEPSVFLEYPSFEALADRLEVIYSGKVPTGIRFDGSRRDSDKLFQDENRIDLRKSARMQILEAVFEGKMDRVQAKNRLMELEAVNEA